MLGPLVLAMLAAGAALSAPVAAQATATQPPAAPPTQTTAEKPWPPPGVMRTGVGVVAPRLIKQSSPNYLSMAMKEKIEGSVWLEAVVETDGTVAEVRVTRSLDRRFGLDDEAVSTVKKWQFVPGRKDGLVVPVVVEIEMSFSLRKQ